MSDITEELGGYMGDGSEIEQVMTQPNQSELFRLASLIGCEPESEERHRQDLLAYITANYTPNTEVAKRERVARIDELNMLDTRSFMSTGKDAVMEVWQSDIDKRISELKSKLTTLKEVK